MNMSQKNRAQRNKTTVLSAKKSSLPAVFTLKTLPLPLLEWLHTSLSLQCPSDLSPIHLLTVMSHKAPATPANDESS